MVPRETVGVSAPHVIGLARSAEHAFSKTRCDALFLVEGLGVDGDAHEGRTVQHLSRVRADPAQPNLRQVHLIHAELFDELAPKGFALAGGDLGENVLTRGVDLLGLPRGTVLAIGDTAIRVTGLRNPCRQIEAFMPGLLAEMVERRPDGSLRRKCGVMAVVERGGRIAVGDAIEVRLTAGARLPLEPV
jgi:MOSC domain-containing protein YiiM